MMGGGPSNNINHSVQPLLFGILMLSINVQALPEDSAKFLAHHPCFKGMNTGNVSLFLPVPTTAAYHQLYVQINYVRTVHNWSIRSDHLFKVSHQLCINILTNCLQQRKCNYINIYCQLNALQLNAFFADNSQGILFMGLVVFWSKQFTIYFEILLKNSFWASHLNKFPFFFMKNCLFAK